MEQPDAAILTAIGIGAAFGVLVALALAALLIRLIAWAADKYAARRARAGEQPAESDGDPEARRRARAAAAAVVALIESKPNLRRDSDGG